MRYIEYVWLVSLLFLTTYMVLRIETLRPINLVILLLGIVISAFMYVYRRNLRQHQEKRLEEEQQRLESSLKHDKPDTREQQSSDD